MDQAWLLVRPSRVAVAGGARVCVELVELPIPIPAGAVPQCPGHPGHTLGQSLTMSSQRMYLSYLLKASEGLKGQASVVKFQKYRNNGNITMILNE